MEIAFSSYYSNNMQMGEMVKLYITKISGFSFFRQKKKSLSKVHKVLWGLFLFCSLKCHIAKRGLCSQLFGRSLQEYDLAPNMIQHRKCSGFKNDSVLRETLPGVLASRQHSCKVHRLMKALPPCQGYDPMEGELKSLFQMFFTH